MQLFFIYGKVTELAAFYRWIRLIRIMGEDDGLRKWAHRASLSDDRRLGLSKRDSPRDFQRSSTNALVRPDSEITPNHIERGALIACAESHFPTT